MEKKMLRPQKPFEKPDDFYLFPYFEAIVQLYLLHWKVTLIFSGLEIKKKNKWQIILYDKKAC